DMTFFLMALGLFVYLAPKHVVDEHRRHLKGTRGVEDDGPVVEGRVRSSRER
ncbi:MAG: hypothetical protein GXO36_07130, partial [Chloroflexi bacterium]|nr:hypothetical protein [Chloroflexota bacterium]